MEQRLAILGGKPAFDKRIGYGRQFIDGLDIQAVVDVLNGDFLTCGPKIEEAEKKLCKITGARYAVLVSNGTAALHAACHAAGISKGDEVITTPITFAASVNCILYCGGKPVFADIDPNTYNIDPKDIENKITDKTKAIIVVDFTGQAADLEPIRDICRKHRLHMIEDAAHAIGTKYKGLSIGSIADMTTFSFHPVKTVTAGEGGAIVTSDKALYKKLLLFRTHGITRNKEWMDDRSEGDWYYEQIGIGMNYRLTDMQAALLNSQLEKLDIFSKRRKEIVKMYDQAFEKMSEIVVQKEIPQSDTVRHLYLLQLNIEMLDVGRKEIYDALVAENIGSNVHYIPVYYFPYYQKMGYKRGLCPEAERLYERLVTIPLFYGMTDQDVHKVIQTVKKIIDYYRKDI